MDIKKKKQIMFIERWEILGDNVLLLKVSIFRFYMIEFSFYFFFLIINLIFF